MRLNFKKTMPFDKKRDTHFEIKILKREKIHTLREDTKKRWGSCRYIQMTNGSRFKPNVFKTAKCTDVQEVEIAYIKNTLSIKVDIKVLDGFEILQFIKNDGFDHLYDFIIWFFPKGDGKIKLRLIHWTDLRY